MPLVITKEPIEYWWPATAYIPTGDETIAHQFKVKFAFAPDVFQQLDEQDNEDAMLDKMIKVIVDWQGIEDQDGKAIPHSPEMLKQLMEIPFISRAITHAWYDSMQANKAQAKN